MIVLLKSNWFDGAKLHLQGRIDYSGPKEELPATAVILSEDGTLPVASNSPKAGFGAKPMEEQIMDLVGMGPTHQIIASSDENLTDEERAERDASALEDRKAAAQARRDASDVELEKLREETERGLAAANTAFAAIEPAIDPIAAAETTDTPPAKDKNAVDPFAKTKK